MLHVLAKLASKLAKLNLSENKIIALSTRYKEKFSEDNKYVIVW